MRLDDPNLIVPGWFSVCLFGVAAATSQSLSPSASVTPSASQSGSGSWRPSGHDPRLSELSPPTARRWPPWSAFTSPQSLIPPSPWPFIHALAVFPEHLVQARRPCQTTAHWIAPKTLFGSTKVFERPQVIFQDQTLAFCALLWAVSSLSQGRFHRWVTRRFLGLTLGLGLRSWGFRFDWTPISCYCFTFWMLRLGSSFCRKPSYSIFWRWEFGHLTNFHLHRSILRRSHRNLTRR